MEMAENLKKNIYSTDKLPFFLHFCYDDNITKPWDYEHI